jgi:predicted alpha/beta superfamily hydrolase
MKIILFLSIAFFLAPSICAQHKIKFVVNQPAKSHTSDTLFVAGNFNNWDPSLKENSFSVDENGNGMYEMQLPAGNCEYKFTRGNWNQVEVTAGGKDIGNRNLLVQGDTTIYVSIEGWKDDFRSEPVIIKHTASKQVKILDSAFTIPQLNRTRRIWIYLPQDYYAGKKRYPVIYMHDGQNVFDDATSGFGEWGVDEYLDSIFAKGQKESIVVAIDNGQSKRMNEYNPYDCKKTGKGEGNSYVDFLVKTVKPYIDKHFHTLGNKENTFIAGSSMAGLISFYAVLKYPSVFGGAGIFSPSFWTAAGMDKDVNTLASKLNSKLFFYAGEKESEDMVPDMRRIEQRIKILSKSKVFEITDPEAKHNEAAWRKYFPDFYKWIINN